MEDSSLRKLMIGALSALMLVLGLVGGVQAAPGPNGNNDHGLCTAYFNGQKNGHDKHGSPGPFAALEEAADDGDDNTSVAEDVYNFCQAAGIGGNPSHGRYPGCFDEDDSTAC
jgi:hypothetical protein